MAGQVGYNPSMAKPKQLIEFQGKKLSIQQWSVVTGIPESTIRARINQFGWSVEDALTIPSNQQQSTRGPGSGSEMPKPCPPVKRDDAGNAYCRWSHAGRRLIRYFGRFGSPEAIRKYQQFQRDWIDGKVAPRPKSAEIIVLELAGLYLAYAREYYKKLGKSTSELAAVRSSLRVLCEVSGGVPVVDFGPDELRAVQSAMIEEGLSRKTINGYIGRVVRMFRWGAAQTDDEKRIFVPTEVLTPLEHVQPLQAGRTNAVESVRVGSVTWDVVEKTMEQLSTPGIRRERLSSLVMVHWLTGMRSSELLGMRASDIDFSQKAWKYVVPLGLNKNAHRDQKQSYRIGPRAQEIIRPLVDESLRTGLPIFTIPTLVAERAGVSGTSHPSTATGSAGAQGDGDEVGSASQGEIEVRAIDAHAYRRFIQQAAARAGLPRWHPHQIRHARATEINIAYRDIAAVAAAIGDSPDVAARVYVDPDDEIQMKIAMEMG